MPVNPFRKSRIRDADSLHLAFFPMRIAEVAFAPIADGAESWAFFEIMDAPRPKSPKVRIERERESTFVRARIEWAMIHLDERPDELPWNLVIHKTGKDGRWAGAWVMSDGTVFRKTVDGSDFGLIVAED